MYHDIEADLLALHDPLPVRHGAGQARVHHAPLKGKIALAGFVLLTIAYFSYRIPLWNPAAPALSSILLAAELFGTMTLFLHVVSTWALVERRAPPPPASFEADVFITTWNEDPAILRHTLLAAKQVSRARFIWLLDDGGRAEMRALAEELGVKYLSRVDRSHAKAGNLNNALAHTDAEFVAIFDCDHAPSPEFLERTLGYFIDPGVALVQTPQDFYNVDSFQHRASAAQKETWHEQTLFYRVIQAGKDYWNSTFFCGSCAVIRRSALDRIGGVATGTITEDMHTSLRLHKDGWSGVYHAEALAFGLSPTDLEQYETQRLRWGRGAMQVWRKEGILFTKGLTFAQRIAYFTSAVTYFEGWQKAVVYCMPIVVLATGWMPIIWTGLPFLALFGAWLLSGMLVNEIFSRGYAKSLYMEEYNYLRFFTFIKATLALVIPVDWKFSVTPKTLTSRAGVSLALWPQLLVLSAAILAIPLGLTLYRSSHYLPAGAFLANLVWTTITAVIGIRALRFVRTRGEQRRSDHRFPIPLIATLEQQIGGAAEPIAVIADNVSSNGFSFLIEDGCRVADQITGQLRLPGGSIPFVADVVQVVELAGRKGRRVATRLAWKNAADADPLNACLYGNTLQWDVNGWAETRRSGLKTRLRQLLGRGGGSTPPWQFARLQADSGEKVECLVRAEEDGFRVLTMVPLPATSDLSLRIGQGARARTHLQVAGYRAYSIGGGHLHMAVLKGGNEGRAAISYHREPAWANTLEIA
ncbi:glycosyltransferase [Novosphingobium tardum]|uniref:Glycosyltransferase n=1 Tax=Novosphingobium tardum TaxID=1538021 RepID=A0ABV8RTZ6_9SPHN